MVADWRPLTKGERTVPKNKREPVRGTRGQAHRTGELCASRGQHSPRHRLCGKCRRGGEYIGRGGRQVWGGSGALRR